jgi:hypothetical protein
VIDDSREDAAMPKGKKAKQAKIRRVLKEFKNGTLKSSSGEKITDRRRAIAIALSEAGMSMQGKSDAYWDSYVLTIMGEGEEEEEGPEEMEDSEEGKA